MSRNLFTVLSGLLQIELDEWQARYGVTVYVRSRYIARLPRGTATCEGTERVLMPLWGCDIVHPGMFHDVSTLDDKRGIFSAKLIVTSAQVSVQLSVDEAVLLESASHTPAQANRFKRDASPARELTRPRASWRWVPGLWFIFPLLLVLALTAARTNSQTATMLGRADKVFDDTRMYAAAWWNGTKN